MSLFRVTIPFCLACVLVACAEQAAAPSSATTPAPVAASAYDLSGGWAFSGGGKINVQQTGNRVIAIFAEGNSLCSAGHKYIDAKIEGARLVGTRWVCNRPDSADLVAQIDPTGRRISFSIPSFGPLELTR